MNIEPSSFNFYRYNFDELIEKQSNRDVKTQDSRADDPLIAQVVTSRSAMRFTPPAPQGLDEVRQTPLQTPESVTDIDKGSTVQQIEAKDDTWIADSSILYTTQPGKFKPPLAVRQNLEQDVRKRKKTGLPCPYVDKNNHCSALFIRCGDRVQFAHPESIEQRNMPHTCLYRPRRVGKYILIVDSNKAVRDFCKNSIELFFTYNPELLLTAGSGYEAIEVLTNCKLEGKQFGLLICGTDLTGISGYDVVNELYERNYNTEVLLTKDQNDHQGIPENFKGLKEIIPEQTVVKKIINKPFHSLTFIETLKSLDISYLFRQ